MTEPKVPGDASQRQGLDPVEPKPTTSRPQRPAAKARRTRAQSPAIPSAGTDSAEPVTSAKLPKRTPASQATPAGEAPPEASDFLTRVEDELARRGRGLLDSSPERAKDTEESTPTQPDDEGSIFTAEELTALREGIQPMGQKSYFELDQPQITALLSSGGESDLRNATASLDSIGKIRQVLGVFGIETRVIDDAIKNSRRTIAMSPAPIKNPVYHVTFLDKGADIPGFGITIEQNPVEGEDLK